MKHSLSLFNEMFDDIEKIKILYNHIKVSIKPPYDYSDLLRWQWVQSLSALDKFLHDIVRIGMIEIYLQKRIATKKYLQFKLNLDIHSQMQKDHTRSIMLFENFIARKHVYLSFQDPDKIRDALSYIWQEEHKWQVIADKMNTEQQHVITTLKNISIRRNQIVHEGDYSSITLKRQEIDEQDVTYVVDFIKNLGNSIGTCIQ